MRLLRCLILLNLLFIVPLFAHYERRLQSFDLEECNGQTKISFTLDDDSVFVGVVSDLEMHKVFSLDQHIHHSVRIVGNRVSLRGLQLILGCSTNEKIDKIDFLVAPTLETYTNLPTVVQIVIEDFYINQFGYVTLSDGSIWDLVTLRDIRYTTHYWAEGDRILVTKAFGRDQEQHHLVNLDISGEYFYNRYWLKGNCCAEEKDFFSIDNPQNISACLLE